MPVMCGRNHQYEISMYVGEKMLVRLDGKILKKFRFSKNPKRAMRWADRHERRAV